jgi:hypothetical protein
MGAQKQISPSSINTGVARPTTSLLPAFSSPVNAERTASAFGLAAFSITTHLLAVVAWSQTNIRFSAECARGCQTGSVCDDHGLRPRLCCGLLIFG